MKKWTGYQVLSDIEYSKPFKDGSDIFDGSSKKSTVHIESKTCLDLFLPDLNNTDGECASELNGGEPTRDLIQNGETSGCVSGSSKDESASVRGKFGNKSGEQTTAATEPTHQGEENFQRKPPPPPLVVFAYGGGWRRGDKQAWRHYFSRWDVNLPLAAIVRRKRFYTNFGESFSSRGIPCAVISYPLVPTPFPINFIELGMSFLFTLAFTLLIALPLYLLLSAACLLSPLQESLSTKLWTFLQNHSSYPISSLLMIIPALAQIITLIIIIWREGYYAVRKLESERDNKLVSLSALIGVLAVCPPLLWAVSLKHSQVLNAIFLSAMLLVVVQCLVYHYHQRTSYQANSLDTTKRKWSALVATPEGQAECIALALKWLVDYGQATGHFDATSIVLAGHSAGGHLVSLVTLDHTYLSAVGVSPDVIKGVITLSAVHDLRSISFGPFYHLYLKPAFGTDPAHWARMSPIDHVQASSGSGNDRLSESNSATSPVSRSSQKSVPSLSSSERSSSSAVPLSSKEAATPLAITKISPSPPSPSPSAPSPSPSLSPSPSPSSLSPPLSSPSPPSAAALPSPYLLPQFLSTPPSSSSSSSVPSSITLTHRPCFLIISAEQDFKFMIEDSTKMYARLQAGGYLAERTVFEGRSHFSMLEEFGCPWYQGWFSPGRGRGRRSSTNRWVPQQGEKICWDFVGDIQRMLQSAHYHTN